MIFLWVFFWKPFLFWTDFKAVQSVSFSMLLGVKLQNWGWPKSHRWTFLHEKLCPTQKRRRRPSWPSRKKVISHIIQVDLKRTVWLKPWMHRVGKKNARFLEMYIFCSGCQLLRIIHQGGIVGCTGVRVARGSEQQVEGIWFEMKVRWGGWCPGNIRCQRRD